LKRCGDCNKQFAVKVALLMIAKEKTMATPASLAVGEHLLVNDPVIHWDAGFSDTRPPSVVLTASVQAGPTPPISQYMATTVAVQMNAIIAMQLYEKLGELGRKMGWPPQK
jgi:hypothetical protein